MHYLRRAKDVLYYDTKTPYTSLYYETGGGRGNAENYFRILHTQNINPNWNFVLNYDLISSDGQYMSQKNKVYNFSFATQYAKNRYRLNFFVNQNRLSIQENGGIVDDFFVRDTTMDARNIQVNLTDSQNKLSNSNFFVSQSYEMGPEKEIIQDKDTVKHYPVRLMHTLEYESDSRKFMEKEINPDYYENYFFSKDITSDKTTFSSLTNTFQFILNENNNKWIRLGSRLMLGNQLFNYNGLYHRDIAVLSSLNKKFHNNFIKGSLYSQSGPSLNWTANVQYYFEGYRASDMRLDYSLTKWIGKKERGHSFSAFAKLETTTPNFIFTEFNSNHQIWKNNFNTTKEIQVGLCYLSKPLNLKVLAQINQLHDYIYFDSNAQPKQFGGSLRVATLSLEKEFVLGHFHLIQKVVGQKASNENVTPVPTFSIYSNNFYTNTFFGGALDIQTGFTLYYNSKFYAPNYMPSTGQFMVQNEKKLGDYPKVDLYFNFRIGRTRLFVMYEHLNAKMGSRNYFTSSHYPLNPAMLKYGLIWTFYN